jgi:hypothetical protein
MRTPNLNRTQRRRLRKLAEPLRRITQGDLNWFAAFPDRKYRVREADIAEIEYIELIDGGLTLSPGKRHCTAIRYLTPVACLCLSVGGPADIDPESLDEELARAVFNYVAPDDPRVYMQGGYGHAEILAIIEALNDTR